MAIELHSHVVGGTVTVHNKTDALRFWTAMNTVSLSSLAPIGTRSLIKFDATFSNADLKPHNDIKQRQ